MRKSMRPLKSEYDKLETSVYAFLRRLFKKDTAFGGNARDICAAIVSRAWNGTFYQIGLGHFNFFWMRDFGTVSGPLVALGQRDRVQATVGWALKHYREEGYVALCLSPMGGAFDQPLPSIDALAWLLHAVRVSEYPLSAKERAFLEHDMSRYCSIFIDPDTGLLHENKRISELRDAVRYRRSAYAVTMLALLRQELELLDIPLHPSLKQDYREILERDYWNGEYFDADLGNSAWSSEANLFPFWLGIVEDSRKLSSVIATIQKKSLTDPYPIRYTDEPNAFTYYAWGRYFMPNYQGTTLWTWLGAIYLQVLHGANHPDFAKEYEKFAALLEKHRNFPEMLQSDGSWYKTPFYRAEQGMLWAAIFLEIPLDTHFLKTRKESLESSSV